MDGFKGNAVTMGKMLETSFTGIEVILENYPAPLPKRLLSKVVPVFQIFPRLGFVTPPAFYFTMRQNRSGTIATAWLLGNALQSFLQSSGAFEVLINDELIFSKLKEKRFPSEFELKDIVGKRLSNSRIAMDVEQEFSGPSVLRSLKRRVFDHCVMASSAENPQMAPTLCGVTAAPPPTPSTLPSLISTTDAADALSRLLRLPPTLSLPSRLAPRTTSPPSVAFSQDNPNFLNPILSSSSTSSNSVSFNSPTTTYPQNLPFDYNDDGEEDGEDGNGESFCFDKSCSTESTQSLSSLKEFAHSLEKVGLETIKALSHAAGFENPLGEDGAASSRFSSLLWISEGVPGNNPGFPVDFIRIL
ncbi:hypothetical protein C5167_003750 [Papaver somniferum]|uniref:Uncharacterized protein n=1 Tax=Papaver somniferum TaxID=3469 RepID=A0A4Y7L520_PAPSO|nr:hypothetical protein C5167_003750 [Papaver somniferum]